MRKTLMKSVDCKESDAPQENRTLRPILDGMGARLSEAVGDRSLRSVAQSTGLSEGTLRALLKGGFPSLATAALLAHDLDVRLGWLAIGELPMRADETSNRVGVRAPSLQWPARLDQPVDTLARIISTVDHLVDDLGIKADANLKAQLVAGIYQNAAEYGSIEPVIEKLRLTLGALQSKFA
jgi:transcriptional regulator with XRE-family HTH domain